ncbi:MAG: hypothetical protein FJ090_06910 [Deltaproteobacteria bacterium]|nr:hypothetical protein [Deltaproteobacteria bacterium]
MVPGRWKIAVAVAALLLASGWACTEAGPDSPRHLESLPSYARNQGYGLYRLWERGRAWRWSRAPRPAVDGALLVDEWHSRKQPIDSVLDPGEYDYDSMHGLGRAFAPVREAMAVRPVGWRLGWDPVGTLDGASALFINLPSGDGPGFRWSEVRAIDRFVRAGGGLLLVTDHSDCYAHGDMLAQLAEVLGFSLPPVTAVDAPYGLGPRARAWFETVQVFPHEITDGVSRLGFMTAGSVEGLHTVASTSLAGFADRFEPGRKAESAGFTGNLERSDDEPSGPVPIVAAGEVGRGRVVVIADQNALGATMIGYGDNHRLFTNAMSWVTRRAIATPSPRVTTLGPGCADTSDLGFRTLQVMIARRASDGCARDGTGERWVALPHGAVPEHGRGIVVSEGAFTPGVDGAYYRLPMALVNNAALGGERDDPARAGKQGAHRVVDEALDWLLVYPADGVR